MKTIITTLSILLFAHFGNARAIIVEEFMPEIMLDESVKDFTIDKSQSKYVFIFRNLALYENSSRKIKYSIDGIANDQKMGNQQEITIISTPGNHAFQFYYNDAYYEIYSDSLHIQPGYKNTYSVYFTDAIYQIEVEKPVIYVYPEMETEIELSVDIKDTPLLLYPKYDGSWKFTATPTGELKFDHGTYDYLFWESTREIVLPQITSLKGFLVKGENVVTFLEEKLTLAGLNSKEQADFITYWGPRLAVNAFNFVRFEFNEECDKYAEIGCLPRPENIFRINMQWHGISAPIEVEEQEIISASRKGFYIIEWGGQEIKRGKIRNATNTLLK